jgi:hypothetical protein
MKPTCHEDKSPGNTYIKEWCRKGPTCDEDYTVRGIPTLKSGVKKGRTPDEDNSLGNTYNEE